MGTVRLAACSPVHLQSTYQGHATNHKSKGKTRKQLHQTQPVPCRVCWNSLACASTRKAFCLKLVRKHPKIRVKIILKAPFILTSHLETQWLRTKDTCSGTRLFWGYLLYDKYTVTWEEVSKRMKILLIQNSFMLLTCPELLHVTVNNKLERLSGLYSTLPTVSDASCQPQYGRLEYAEE